MRLHFCFVEGSADYETCYDFLSANVSVGCKLHFSGQVRNDNCEKGEVQAIVYSAYSEMVLKEFENYYGWPINVHSEALREHINKIDQNAFTFNTSLEQL